LWYFVVFLFDFGTVLTVLKWRTKNSTLSEQF
jgi:hypothetical protein